MTTIEARDQTENNKLSISDSMNNNLTLPEHFDENNPPALSPLASLERLVSNPLIRGYSNVSVSSDNGAHFVPFGRGHDDIANTPEDRDDAPLNQFLFNSPNIEGFNVNDESFINDDTINCITPVQSLLAKQQRLSQAAAAHNVLQQHLGPLEDGDTDIDNRTDRTQTTTSSQVVSSQDVVPCNVAASEDIAATAAPSTAAVGAKPFNVEAAPFIPAFAPQTQPLAMMDPNINAFVPMGTAMPMMMPPIPMMPAPHMMMAHDQNVAPRINLDILSQGAVMPLHPNAVQGSQAEHTPNHSNTPNTPYRKNSGGSYHDIARNYSPDQGGGGSQHGANGSRSPIQPQQQQQRGWNMRGNNNQRGRGGKYAAKQKQGGGPRHNEQRQQGQMQNLQGMEIQDIIKMNASLPVLLHNRLICQFMKHQNGSRYIQEKIKNSSTELIDRILRHIIFEEGKILELSKDIFGNYVIQIFFKYPDQHRLLVDHLLTGNVYVLSRHFYGCRVIQAAFDDLALHESKRLICELENESKKKRSLQMEREQPEAQDLHYDEEDDQKSLIHQCIICPNANHVIQKIITLELEIECIQFIIDCIATNICYYSSHIFGCRIVQNIINYYGYHNDKEMLKEMIRKANLLHLCQSQYGNYVIQHILKLSFFQDSEQPDDCHLIKQQVIKSVFENVVYLSKNKYGSNVVENCLDFATDLQKEVVLNAIINKKSKQILCEMVKHKYANYVIQRLLNSCNVKQQKRLVNAIERNVTNLRTLNYGKHIMDKIKKLKQQTGFQPYGSDANANAANQPNTKNKRFYKNF
mmetsp:Transcript_60922/g.96840  ORF Transcript_60922/g.96840 Transcript_60922/m.96840 type:complete len:803 (-) Transcript_60922:1475-3883(-)